jgi:hypothetical protein
VAAVGAIALSLLYIAISLILTGLVGRALSRSGRAFLDAAFTGQGGVAEAASRLLVVTFYLLSLGFIALTLPSWSNVTTTARALQLLSGRLGVLLLVLGVLHLTSTLVFARLRRGRPGDEQAADPAGSKQAVRPADSEQSADASSAGSQPDPVRLTASSAPAALWRPRPPRVVH